jgi:hypothetical protein
MWYMANINHVAIEFDYRLHTELHLKANGT